jgi:hypothetical protein
MPENDNMHLPPGSIAAYVDGTAALSDRSRLEAHVASCLECRNELLTVSGVVRAERRRRRTVVAVPLGAAAAIALAAVGISSLGGGPGPGALTLRSEPSEGTARFEVVTPGDGDTVNTQNLLIVWRQAAAESPHYRFTLTDQDGTVLWSSSVADTSIIIPADIRLDAGQSYYWYVDALLDRGRTATSGISKFVVDR